MLWLARAVSHRDLPGVRPRALPRNVFSVRRWVGRDWVAFTSAAASVAVLLSCGRYT